MVDKSTIAWLKRVPLLLIAGVLLLALAAVRAPQAQASTFPGANGKVYYSDEFGIIKKANLDGSNAQTVLTSATDHLSPSPNGTKLVFDNFNGADFDLHIANIDGTNNVKILGGSSSDSHPSWSPDGSKVVYVCNSGSQQICTVNADGSGRVQLTNEALDNENPSWSPDGTKIVYQKTAGGNGVDIYVMNPDGSNKTALANTSAHEQEPRWSPDGSKIVYSRFIDNTYLYEVYRMNADGSSQTRMTTHTEYDVSPTYSPDGTKIYYLSESNGFGLYKLYRMDSDGSNPTKLIDSQTIGFAELQSLTLGPTSSNTNPTVQLVNKVATIDVPAMFSDPYGAGIDNSTVTVTSTPSSGTTAVNLTTGVITYNYTAVSVSRNWLSTIGNIFFPKVSAATTDSFNYQVCSQSSASLCSSGTVTVSLIGVSSSGYGSSGSLLAPVFLTGGLILTFVGGSLLVKNRKVGSKPQA
ncbi:MAG: TolB protein [Patescibacteria group bacterium]|nr:TolB protein [Patescibacteria group bacterium]